MKWITVILGIALLLTPFLFGYSGTSTALWTCLIIGAIITILGFIQSYKWAAGVGVLTLIAPWILGFSGISAALWSCLILGGLVVILTGYRGFLSGQPNTENIQQRA